MEALVEVSTSEGQRGCLIWRSMGASYHGEGY